MIEFAEGQSFDDYAEDAMLRSAVERQFEIIGEALNQLSKIEPDIVARVSGYKRIIALKRLLSHHM